MHCCAFRCCPPPSSRDCHLTAPALHGLRLLVACGTLSHHLHDPPNLGSHFQVFLEFSLLVDTILVYNFTFPIISGNLEKEEGEAGVNTQFDQASFLNAWFSFLKI